jgi:hypothetical protein
MPPKCSTENCYLKKGHQMSEEIGDWGMLQLEIVKMKMQM